MKLLMESWRNFVSDTEQSLLNEKKDRRRKFADDKGLDEELDEDIELYEEDELDEVYSDKQRKWACAQTGKSRKNFSGKPPLSKSEADEMCSGPMKK